MHYATRPELATDAATAAPRRSTASTCTTCTAVLTSTIIATAIAAVLPTAATISAAVAQLPVASITATALSGRSQLALLWAPRVYMRLVCPTRPWMPHIRLYKWAM